MSAGNDGTAGAPIDGGRAIDWSRTSSDYASHRPGPPARLYDLLAALGVGGSGQRLLDLGTGTGLVASELARRGAVVSGIDVRPRPDRRRSRKRARGRPRGRLRRRCRGGGSFRRRELRRRRRQPVLDVLRRRANARRSAARAAARRRAGDDALQLAAAGRSDRQGERGAGAPHQSGLARRRLARPHRDRARLGGRTRQRRGDVLVRRRRAVHARGLARPDARLPGRRRVAARRRRRRLRRRARRLARSERGAHVHRAPPHRRAPVHAVAGAPSHA